MSPLHDEDSSGAATMAREQTEVRTNQRMFRISIPCGCAADSGRLCWEKKQLSRRDSAPILLVDFLRATDNDKVEQNLSCACCHFAAE